MLSAHERMSVAPRLKSMREAVPVRMPRGLSGDGELIDDARILGIISYLREQMVRQECPVFPAAYNREVFYSDLEGWESILGLRPKETVRKYPRRTDYSDVEP